jgi:biotin carboxylase
MTRGATVVYVVARGGVPPAYVLSTLSTLRRMEVDLVCAYVVPADATARQQSRELYGRYGEIVEVNSVDVLALEAATALGDRRVDGVVALSELIVDQAAELAERLGVPTTPARVQRDIANKHRQRELLTAGGVPCPAFALIRDAADLASAFRSIGAPGVLKPVSSAASYLTFLARSEEELAEQYAYANAELRAHQVRPGSADFLYEELLRGVRWHDSERYGDYVSVESIVHDHVISHICVTDKLPLVHPFREAGSIVPSALPPDQQERCLAVAERAIRALGVTHAATHVELKLTADDPWVIEVNGRVGGPIPYLHNLVAPVDIFEQIVRSTLGIAPVTSGRFTGVAALYRPHGPPDRLVRVSRVAGLERVLADPAVVACDVVKPAGSIVDWRRGTAEGLARIVVRAPGHDALWTAIDRVNAAVRFDFEELVPSEDHA